MRLWQRMLCQYSFINQRHNRSGGCKNDENRANVTKLDSGLTDGTRISAIQKTRKRNRNNTSGVIGVTYDKERKLWKAQISFQGKNHVLGRFKTKEESISARKQGEEYYFGKYRK